MYGRSCCSRQWKVEHLAALSIPGAPYTHAAVEVYIGLFPGKVHQHHAERLVVLIQAGSAASAVLGLLPALSEA